MTKKVTAIKDRNIVTEELDLEYPYYLYFEDGLDSEYHRVNKEYTIVVKDGLETSSIEQRLTYMQDSHIILRNLTTAEDFFNAYDTVLNSSLKFER